MWYFSSSKSLQKIEKLQERALRFLYNDHTSSYVILLLLKSNKCTMLVARQRILCIEIFKTVKQSNPPFMQNIFRLRSSHYSLKNPNSLGPTKQHLGQIVCRILGHRFGTATKRNKVSRKSKKFQDFDKTMEWSHIQMYCLQIPITLVNMHFRKYLSRQNT